MSSIMDEYLDNGLDNDDIFPCKGCGEILEEGKAFELAGNRWHINCFRCHTCKTLLDSDANLLLLGDGSLVCNNCTYSCGACGNQIEELAILTGDQSFCATCFRCRNCKRKIENLRYAKTSQGIFCMSCHESLMARRRKKSKAAAQSKAREKDASPMITDKSLPALPPNAIPPNAFSDTRVDPDSDTPTELSPRPRPAYKNDSSSRSSSRPARSPERPSEPNAKETGPGLSSSNYRANRNSTMIVPSNASDTNGGEADGGFFIPVALDPTPSSTGTPRSVSDNFGDPAKRRERDYFDIPATGSSSETRSASQASTPHIAFQNRGLQPPADLDHSNNSHRKPPKPPRQEPTPPQRSTPNLDERTLRTTVTSKPQPGQDDFKLQDAPKTKRSSPGVRGHAPSPSQQQTEGGSDNGPNGSWRGERDGKSPPRLDTGDGTTSRTSQDSRFRDEDPAPRPSTDSHSTATSRLDNTTKSIARKELPPSASRLPAADQKKPSDTYMQPRAPPPPPPPPSGAGAGAGAGAGPFTPGRDVPGSAADSKGEKTSPSLPRWSAGGDFTMDEDMARILGTDEGSSSILRRVSNAVRHGRTNSTDMGYSQSRGGGHARSVSETTRGTTSPRWPKTPVVMEGHASSQSHDMSSPISLHSSDDPAFLKRQLRNSEQRVAELERQFTNEKDLKNLNRKLSEKRTAVSVLDTQNELMIQQIQALARYAEKAKERKTPIDPRDLQDFVIKDFVQKLEEVRQSMSESIERLHQERDKVVEEKNRATADRDRALLEFEQLSSKNAQLADMNNDLTHQIQERFKSQIGSHPDLKSPGGLGIYTQQKGTSGSSVNLGDAASVNTATTLIAQDHDDSVMEARPTVVDIRKGQARKFNWKKGSKTMAQNVAKGVNRAVVAFQQERDGRHQQGLSGDTIGLPYNMTVAAVDSPVSATPNGQGPIRHHQQHHQHHQHHQQQQQGQQNESRQGFGFFKKNNVTKSASANNLTTPTGASDPAPAEPPSTLFGSELVERADYERRQIPSVVTRCIEEVELRGMDIEGIYRKTGGNSLVKMLQEGFDKNEDFDISDPELDITAVTSVLKQYFRRLPTPLLTFDVYDRVLESIALADVDDRCDFLRKTFDDMPQQHSDCLEFLMFHLARVAKREPENLMSPKNLAVVFAPTIMRDNSLEREMTDMHAKSIAVQFVIEHSDTIFTD
ncbi:rho-type GTPase-activating protein [Sodiomyces alkalinus F11]|uniref:Rho-type GTPase-activating protein n=1 Tax=Sodiomyces alkalinus (strain CBS 110278 / VKM F-3762 / F11) TaxID=1314773 RepID=A0A3N2PW99_SODAK|nr:rho-type GTPase-activating protein [Sodiomyces alkalinus F11]ROT38656.1 rho-type GTPase-activating protein [Sodiomyces alkalinus F11]